MMSSTTSSPVDPQAVAVITGAARGIGLAIARWFLQRDHRVALWDRDGATLPGAAAALVAEFGPERVLASQSDVSVPAQVDEAVARTVAAFGRIDALVNNAGVAVFKPCTQTSFGEWREVMATNLDGAFLCTQAAAAVMLQGQRGGAIVNIASISGLRASTLRVAYGTSKAALLHLTKQFAAELGCQGIRVNAVCPGPVETEMARQVHDTAIRRDYFAAIPMERYGTVDEIADAVGFLCSSSASFVNGQFLAVDGGFDASGVGIPTLRQNLRG
jgi:NAD(P)-dependent dehydrogenase (short-subunit alcohol dehydrogenase family)